MENLSVGEFSLTFLRSPQDQRTKDVTPRKYLELEKQS